MEPYNYSVAKERFEGLSRSFGIGALVCSVIFSSVPYIPIGLGFLAILFALLSKGYSNKLSKVAKSGIQLGILAIVMSIVITGLMVVRILTDSEYRSTLLTTIDTMYGDVYKETYGIDVEEMFNQYLPEIKK